MPSYVITGAARGIGLEFVIQLSADSQNTIFAVVRSKTTATRLIALPQENITVLEADITDPKALDATSEVAKATDGKLDILINNAALVAQPAGETLDSFPSPEELEKDLIDNFKVNTVGVVHTINAFLPLLRKGAMKKVISLSTGLADAEYAVRTGAEAYAPYSISKAALNMAVAKYAVHLKAEGFTFLALSPGLVNTSTSPPTAEQIENFKKLVAKIKTFTPDFEGPISPETSVKMQLDVINRWTVEDTGAFVSHFGNKQWV
ncbi:hypothetical protein C8R43DRAFT_868266 [Mycena crocata]|nr:hypothetical protein C8R43DRAFT_868266 [Mycena crocata]